MSSAVAHRIKAGVYFADTPGEPQMDHASTQSLPDTAEVSCKALQTGCHAADGLHSCNFCLVSIQRMDEGKWFGCRWELGRTRHQSCDEECNTDSLQHP
eukprot:3426668-Rhodomonas_salina.2